MKILKISAVVCIILFCTGCMSWYDKALKSIPHAEFSKFELDGIILDIEAVESKLIDGEINIKSLKMQNNIPGFQQKIKLEGYKRIMK